MIDKYKYTTLSYSKNGLSCRPFHKEGFYRENPLFTRLFRSFCRQMKVKMPIECLSDASWMSLGCLQNALLARSTSSRTTCLRQTRLVMSPSTCGASRSQRKRICHTQPGKPLGIGTRSDREISKNYLQIRRTQFVLASLQPYILTTLHYYVFIFPLLFFGLSAFRSHQNNPPPKKNEARSDAEQDYRSSSAPKKWLEKFFQRAKSDLCGKQKASMLSLF